MTEVAAPDDTYTAAAFTLAFPRESATVEFKRSTSEGPLRAAIVAMSNSGGGVILVGVDDSGAVLGCPFTAGVDEAVNQAAMSAHNVGRYDAKQVIVAGRAITAVTVQTRTEGFAQTSDGRTLVRRGPRSQALLGSELQDFINGRSLRRFELTQTDLRLSDTDGQVLAAVVAQFEWDTDNQELTHRFAERGLMRGSTLTFAGALLLTRPERSLELGKAVVEVRRYPGEDENYDRREVFGGPLQQQVRDAAEFVVDEIGRELVVNGLYRYDMPRLPPVVVREAIANAVAHRTYEIDRVAVVVEIRPDRVMVTSPGRLPEPVTVETMRRAQSARNPAIIAVLRAFALAEDAGRGIDVIQDSMRGALLDPPQFAESGNSVVVTLPLRGPVTSRERAWIQDLERRGELLGDDRLLVVHAARGETLTNAKARAILGTDDAAAARRALQRLRDAGLLDQHGARGAATYSLTRRLEPPAAFRLGAADVDDLVVDAARAQPVSNEQMRVLTGLDRRAMLALLQRLVREGQLRRHGERRGTRYTAT